MNNGAWLCSCGTKNPLDHYTCGKCRHIRSSLSLKTQNRIAEAQGNARYNHHPYNRTWIEGLAKAADNLKI
jgi:hypothetical protein